MRTPFPERGKVIFFHANINVSNIIVPLCGNEQQNDDEWWKLKWGEIRISQTHSEKPYQISISKVRLHEHRFAAQSDIYVSHCKRKRKKRRRKGKKSTLPNQPTPDPPCIVVVCSTTTMQ